VKILVVEDAIRENGGIRVVLGLAARWHHAGHQTTFFVMRRVADEARLQPAVPVRYGQPKVRRLRSALPVIFLRMLWEARKADLIVSVSELGFNVLAAAAAAAITRRPMAIVVHAPLEQSVREWVPRPLRRSTIRVNRGADASICVSHMVKERAIASGVPASRVHVVTNGVDFTEVRRRAEADADLRLPNPLVVGVGRLSEQKGFDLLIRAHADVLRDGHPHHLAIIGEGEARASLEQLIAELGVASSVSLLGFRDNPHALLAQADLFCLSSRWEGYPLVLIEALAVGVPIVATDCVGAAEILDCGRYGDLVEVDSARALAEAIRRHLQAPDRLRAVAAAGVDRASDFDPATCADRYLHIFSELVDRPRLGRRPRSEPGRTDLRRGADASPPSGNLPSGSAHVIPTGVGASHEC
jgi:glycosyltransferase involved in cell wall biosynthesis